ncbi:hypothetical protein CSKR_109116 [Clonorchis sinensis]|uniref:Uncharacterized protein n=1 Tax=Clonorchis sinensis TaxID=79923 RepID=A0A419PZH6_CLOSI|nr:hypothetical protein CSKR_109116 [Clonorchis sinensis]
MLLIQKLNLRSNGQKAFFWGPYLGPMTCSTAENWPNPRAKGLRRYRLTPDGTTRHRCPLSSAGFFDFKSILTALNDAPVVTINRSAIRVCGFGGIASSGIWTCWLPLHSDRRAQYEFTPRSPSITITRSTESLCSLSECSPLAFPTWLHLAERSFSQCNTRDHRSTQARPPRLCGIHKVCDRFHTSSLLFSDLVFFLYHKFFERPCIASYRLPFRPVMLLIVVFCVAVVDLSDPVSLPAKPFCFGCFLSLNRFEAGIWEVQLNVEVQRSGPLRIILWCQISRSRSVCEICTVAH